MQTASGKAKTRADTQKLIEARERLGKFLEEGIELLKATQQEQRPPPIDAVEEWNKTVVSYLGSAMGQSFVTRFGDASGLPIWTTRLGSDAHRNLETGLRVRTARLQQFLSELSPDHLR